MSSIRCQFTSQRSGTSLRVKNFKPQKLNLFSAELVSKQLVLQFPTTALEELRFGRGNEIFDHGAECIFYGGTKIRIELIA